ncbi:metallophosphoesterase [Virgibacillus sediminis]|uniref:Metallophosphoesterase n=1 Tax=Virgibacillus sediminis TaxID=202260 RepID=A0ABV7A8K4_9BACI
MKKWSIFLVFILVILLISIKAYLDTTEFKVNRVQFHSDKLPENVEFTVLQISDLHNKVFGHDNQELIETVNQSNADIVVMTGDIIDRKTDDFQDVFTLVEGITDSGQDVFFVTGNHEQDHDNMEEFLDGLRERNVTVLDNRNTQVRVEGVTVNLAGVADSSTDHEDIERAFAGLQPESYTILLSHSPGIMGKYRNIPADLILSGHTHGGQVRLPFIGPIVAPEQGLFPEFDQGVFETGRNQYLYIDSGLGTSVAPIRFLNKSQLSLITITGSD